MAENEQRLDQVFHALADPTRRELLARLAGGDGTTGRLAEPFALSRPAISKHLKVLAEAGLVARRRDGRHQVYSLEAEGLAEATQWLLRHREFWRGQLAALKRHLEEEAS